MEYRLIDLRIDERIETTVSYLRRWQSARLVDLRIDERIETLRTRPRVGSARARRSADRRED
jgi:hypothetical protein